MQNWAPGGENRQVVYQHICTPTHTHTQEGPVQRFQNRTFMLLRQQCKAVSFWQSEFLYVTFYICLCFSDPVWTSSSSTSWESGRNRLFMGIECLLQLFPWLSDVHTFCVDMWGEWDVDRRRTTVPAWVSELRLSYLNCFPFQKCLAVHTKSWMCLLSHWSCTVWRSRLSWRRIQRGEHLFLPVSS